MTTVDAESIVELINTLAKIDLDYLSKHPEAPTTDATLIPFVEEEAWMDVPTILHDQCTNVVSFTAWRAAELSLRGALVSICLRPTDLRTWQTGVAVVIDLPKTPVKIRRRLRRMMIRRRKGKSHSWRIPGVSLRQEWHPLDISSIIDEMPNMRL